MVGERHRFRRDRTSAACFLAGMPRMSSGDAIADRRFAYAEDYRAAGHNDAAAELMAQALELRPSWPEGWLALGEVHEARGEKDSAIWAYRRALALDSNDPAGAGARLVRLGMKIDADALTDSHVAALFGEFAQTV